MQRELCSFPISQILKNKLRQAGYLAAGDIINLKPSELNNELDISPDEALDLINLIKEANSNNKSKNLKKCNGKTVYEMLQKERLFIISFCENLDNILDGGIQVGKITEICGPPGIGKTQLCFQLAVDVQIPESCGGLEGSAIYIDTEGSFVVDRLVEIAKAAISHCHLMDDTVDICLDNILSKIHYFRCCDYIQFLSLMHILEDFIKTNGNIKLIVVDSLAQIFRHDFEDYATRLRILNGLSQKFNMLCSQFNLAVVLTNHMTTKLSKNGGSKFMVPAMGESWGHCCAYRIILHWTSNFKRNALIYKSPSNKELTALFQITITVNKKRSKELL